MRVVTRVHTDKHSAILRQIKYAMRTLTNDDRLYEPIANITLFKSLYI